MAKFKIDIAGLLKVIGQASRTATLERFEKEIEPDGSKWAPLSPTTISWRRKKGAGHKILQDTGALIQSISVQDPDVNNLSIKIGANVEYAEDLQEGTDIMPARPFLDMEGEDEHANRLIEDAIIDFLERELGVAFDV
jgi:phage virion morphogenesis protein